MVHNNRLFNENDTDNIIEAKYWVNNLKNKMNIDNVAVELLQIITLRDDKN
jgi:hypothetical protein